MRHRYHQLDVSHPFTAHLTLSHYNAAMVAHNPLVADALVFAAMALPVLGGTENAFAEQTVTLRLVGTVVDGFRLGHLPMGLVENGLGGRQADGDF